MKIKPIAIYLPQFHPILENDLWWGRGFTEWTNVTKACPLFKRHYQPHLPSDLGFYDLRCKETRIEQAELAKLHGIEGFAYYHYWFHGKRLLERPFDEVLTSNEPDFPFCLFWANETWSRRWLGEEKEILIKQKYSAIDDINHANFLTKVFLDKRYITVNGRPVFIIYRPGDLPNISRTVETIKNISLERLSVEPYLVASNSHLGSTEGILQSGFDAILNFRPQLGVLPNAFNDNFSYNRLRKNVLEHKTCSGRLKIYNYTEAINLMRKIEPEFFENIIPSVFVGWDNSARRGLKGVVIKNNFPEIFKKELQRVIQKINASNSNPRLVFINAWNEWAEGNHLEPDKKNGTAYLRVIKSIFSVEN